MPRTEGETLCVTALATKHDRGSFHCGVESLDRYFKTQASQDVKRKANAVFVLSTAERRDTVIGYFTLCATALGQGEVPEAARKHIPRYPLVGATLLGRLAISSDRQGSGLGAILLAHALRKAYSSSSSVGSSMVVVDAIGDPAIAFYEAHGFTRLGQSLRLVIAMRTLAALASE